MADKFLKDAKARKAKVPVEAEVQGIDSQPTLVYEQDETLRTGS